MYTLKKVGKFSIDKLCKVAFILNACGKDMADKYNLHHWDNPFFKIFFIVAICNLTNEVYILYNGDSPVATFMVKGSGDSLHFQKLGTLPNESGKGIGSLCMVKIEEIARKKNYKKVVMEVYEPSQHAISFYEHKGYQIVGIMDTLKYREVKMEKSIC